MEIRPFDAASGKDLAGCLAVLDSNANDAAARQEFEQFLGSLSEAGGVRYFVMEHAGEIIGCGGFTVRGEVAQLERGMIRKDLQRQGLGRFLLLFRLKEIGRQPGILFVEAAVPGQLSRFYERNGLKPVGNGAHRMKLQVCAAG